MAVNTLVTKGYGNGTFSGTIALVALKGYVSAEVVATNPATLITRGYGNGTFSGSISLITLKGYLPVTAVIAPTNVGIGYKSSNNKLHYIVDDNRLKYKASNNKLHYKVKA